MKIHLDRMVKTYGGKSYCMEKKNQDLTPQSNKVELLLVPVGGAMVPPEEYSHSAHLQGLSEVRRCFPVIQI